MTEYLDVKTFAESAGVTPQYIYKVINTKLKPFVNRDSGKVMISIDAFAVIGDAQPDLTTVNQQLLDKVVTTLQEQLAIKDGQIDKLQTELSTLNDSYRQLAEQNVKLLDQQQQLNAAQYRLTAGNTDENTSETAPDLKWWQFREKRRHKK